MGQTLATINRARGLVKAIQRTYPDATDKELFQIVMTFVVEQGLARELMVHILEQPEAPDPDPST